MFKDNITSYRLKINEKLNNLNLKNDFFMFLIDDNFNLFSKWFDICCARRDFKKKLKELDALLNFCSNNNNMIPFDKLFELDSEWYLFYKENAYKNGQPKPGEKRLGVDKNTVNDIMIVKKKIKKSLQNSLEFYFKLKIIYLAKIC